MADDGRHVTAVAIGPANYAGQAYLWAESVRRNLEIEALSFAAGRLGRSSRFRFPVHTTWVTPLDRVLKLERVLSKVSHLLLDGFLPPFGLPRIASFERDLGRLRLRGHSIGLVSHGSDTRDPDAHMARHRYSYFSFAPREYVEQLRRASSRNRAIASDSGLPQFVSTPDLLLDNPDARWLPLAVDTAKWKIQREPFSGRIPTILHIPSRRVPPIKGSNFIDPVLRRMENRGLIKYITPERVSHNEMTRIVADADIIIDQILTGSYGVAAVEGMASGRLVIGYVADETRQVMPEEPPIVDAPPDRLEKVLEEFLEDRERSARIASFGPGFAERWHDGRASTGALMDFLTTESPQ